MATNGVLVGDGVDCWIRISFAYIFKKEKEVAPLILLYPLDSQILLPMAVSSRPPFFGASQQSAIRSGSALSDRCTCSLSSR